MGLSSRRFEGYEAAIEVDCLAVAWTDLLGTIIRARRPWFGWHVVGTGCVGVCPNRFVYLVGRLRDISTGMGPRFGVSQENQHAAISNRYFNTGFVFQHLFCAVT
ncbi:MAG: hypothetical protein CBE00_05880 [Planctomycetaceae bacterium TMED240]|nr:hypothetical protein [Rhodopirellula sp.]OUX07271.1 MAG: hypothetical protein CBE00_05880 [Planctomycetaceae bacterium TMED240]